MRFVVFVPGAYLVGLTLLLAAGCHNTVDDDGGCTYTMSDLPSVSCVLARHGGVQYAAAVLLVVYALARAYATWRYQLEGGWILLRLAFFFECLQSAMMMLALILTRRDPDPDADWVKSRNASIIALVVFAHLKMVAQLLTGACWPPLRGVLLHFFIFFWTITCFSVFAAGWSAYWEHAGFYLFAAADIVAVYAYEWPKPVPTVRTAPCTGLEAPAAGKCTDSDPEIADTRKKPKGSGVGYFRMLPKDVAART